MIVDLQTRAWSSAEQLGPALADRLRRLDATRPVPVDASPSRLAAEMECVSATCLLGFRCDRIGAAIPTEFIAEQMRRHPGRIVGVAGIDPLAEDPESQVLRARELGMSGLSVSPSTQGFHPTHSAAMQVFELAERLGMPIWASRPGLIGADCRLEFDRPLAWDEAARSFPRLPIVLGGLGEPWVPETVLLLAKHDRVFADLAGLVGRPWQLFEALHAASSHGVLDRLLFASGFPQLSPAKAIETIYSVNSFAHGTPLPSIPRAALKSIVERDSLASLGIEFEVLPPTPHATKVAAATPERRLV
jgi:hypothetical protein